MAVTERRSTPSQFAFYLYLDQFFLLSVSDPLLASDSGVTPELYLKFNLNSLSRYIWEIHIKPYQPCKVARLFPSCCHVEYTH